ncbi:MAG: hypothetical protein WC911_01625 [Thermoleophilia bacterium]
METWIRKDSIEREDGSDLRITIGTRVKCTRASTAKFLGSVTILPGQVGKVTESGTADRWNSKNATGTIQAAKVEWDAR